MKKIILSLIIIILSDFSFSFAHKEWVHQHIVKEAYYFIEKEIGEIPEIRRYLGLNQFGPEGECSSVDTLLSISIYCWEDARFEGDTINYLKISNLIGDRANPPWTGDSSEMSAPGKIFVADTIKIYFVDTVSQEERFVLQLVGKYSYTIENDSTTAYAIINRLNYLSNGKPQEVNKVINVAIKPNPASNSLNLKYLVLAPTKISVILYDSNGELITKLVDNEEISVGEHQLEYDTQGLSPGTYFLVVMQDGKTKISRKFIIVR
jgi:hypothetical protein